MNSEANKAFYGKLSEAQQKELLQAIASHYGTTTWIIKEEIFNEPCHSVFDYLPAGPREKFYRLR